jgi:hypothetical protein
MLLLETKVRLPLNPIALVCSDRKHQAYQVLVTISLSSLAPLLSFELGTVEEFFGRRWIVELKASSRSKEHRKSSLGVFVLIKD